LVKTIRSPIRITKKSLTLKDVIVTNMQAYKCSSTVIDLDCSDHLAQILNIDINRLERGPVKIKKRQFTKKSISEFNYLLQKDHGRRALKSRSK
jgi:hypothetical protein